MGYSRAGYLLVGALAIGAGVLVLDSRPFTMNRQGDCCGDPRYKDYAEAMMVAEMETSGEAVSARRVELNGTFTRNGLPGGMEVHVHMPGKDKGWRCLIDVDTMKLRSKYAIPNPPSKRRPFREEAHVNHPDCVLCAFSADLAGRHLHQIDSGQPSC